MTPPKRCLHPGWSPKRPARWSVHRSAQTVAGFPIVGDRSRSRPASLRMLHRSAIALDCGARSTEVLRAGLAGCTPPPGDAASAGRDVPPQRFVGMSPRS
jgi:hypothetical protein